MANELSAYPPPALGYSAYVISQLFVNVSLVLGQSIFNILDTCFPTVLDPWSAKSSLDIR